MKSWSYSAPAVLARLAFYEGVRTQNREGDAMHTTPISRDPFSRTTMMRETVPAEDRGPCDWCGRPAARFRYYTEDDSARRAWHGGHRFCGIGCFRSYAG